MSLSIEKALAEYRTRKSMDYERVKSASSSDGEDSTVNTANHNPGCLYHLYSIILSAIQFPFILFKNSKPMKVWKDFKTNRPKLARVVCIVIWFVLFAASIAIEFGMVFFVLSLFYFLYASMRTGPKADDAPSAYSVFNPNCERITGTFTAEQFDNQLRRGTFW